MWQLEDFMYVAYILFLLDSAALVRSRKLLFSLIPSICR